MPAINRKKPIANRAGTYQLTRSGLMGWILVVVLGATLMFVLGVLVGRGQIEYPLAQDTLQQALVKNKQKSQAADQRVVEQLLKGGGARQPLEFHEGVKQTKSPPRPLSSVPAKPPKPKKAPRPPAKPVSPPKVTEKPPPKAKAGKHFTIQVASVRGAQTAEDLVKTLKEMGFGSAYRVIGKIQGRGTWHRVRVGSYGSRKEAQTTLARLKTQKLKGFVILE